MFFHKSGQFGAILVVAIAIVVAPSQLIDDERPTGVQNLIILRL